jgi:hypothetical protein
VPVCAEDVLFDVTLASAVGHSVCSMPPVCGLPPACAKGGTVCSVPPSCEGGEGNSAQKCSGCAECSFSDVVMHVARLAARHASVTWRNEWP